MLPVLLSVCAGFWGCLCRWQPSLRRHGDGPRLLPHHPWPPGTMCVDPGGGRVLLVRFGTGPRLIHPRRRGGVRAEFG